ncbi:uncharacterized protein GGS22DRAFT_197879 [Annulohypoxylon maeteangense]|uniref:uncharacterized protein n=1 Tax=Annulohypoxylon maeteangense TaxID=1927788 RepID=UPI002008BDEF|nr:uncharacterized protein GGS22DRAFT_197879 [Annulohypoxylon maeteangense]KAI0887958.1 hypothetical protein GGS22DRAFT_197879 [Annulohypoxylon maeteangense]
MDPKETDMSPNPENCPQDTTSINEQTPATASASSPKQNNNYLHLSSQPSPQPSLQPEPRAQPYPYPEPQSEQGPFNIRPTTHFCPVTLVLTPGPFCSSCRSSYLSLDEAPTPPPAPPTSPSLSPTRATSQHSLDSSHLHATADDLARRIMQFTEIIRRLTRERDVLRTQVSHLEGQIRMIQEFGLYARWDTDDDEDEGDEDDDDDRKPLLDGVTWEHVDRETELEEGSLVSSQLTNELDTEVVRIDPEWFTL